MNETREQTPRLHACSAQPRFISLFPRLEKKGKPLGTIEQNGRGIRNGENREGTRIRKFRDVGCVWRRLPFLRLFLYFFTLQVSLYTLEEDEKNHPAMFLDIFPSLLFPVIAILLQNRHIILYMHVQGVYVRSDTVHLLRMQERECFCKNF